MTATFEASEKQQVIFDTWRNKDCNILINAVAGSGKTTTLLQLLEYCEHKTLFLAFNKSVQTEIQSKIEERGLRQGKALTIHSLGLAAIKKAHRGYKVNSGKNFDLIKQLQKENPSTFKYMKWEDKLKLSYSIMDMNDVSRLFLTDDMDIIRENLASMDKPLSSYSDLETLWKKFIVIRDKTYESDYVVVDFHDMIYLPVLKNLRIDIDPYYLMIDEAQDLNLCQHRLIENLIGQGTIKKWIAVGDRNQAIYGFSGAYSSSFNLFISKGNVKELPLDICYRCSDLIIDCANEIYDVMEYGTHNPVGVVDTVDSPNSIKPNSMVVCRNSSPLIALYFQLLSLEKNCYIKGDDILNSIIKFLKPYNYHTIYTARLEIMNKLDELARHRTSDAKKIEYYILKENFINFKNLYSHLCPDQSETINYLLNKVKALFLSKEDAIMLCTIHKSKGLEADYVYILNEFLIPSKFAKSPEQLKQESNLKKNQTFLFS